MPCVILAAADFGATGTETREALEADAALKARLEAIRLQAGPLMNLGDVTAKSVPKMTLVSAPPPAARSPRAASSRTGCTPRSASSPPSPPPPPACSRAALRRRSRALPPDGRFLIEHPTGAAEVLLDLAPDGTLPAPARSAPPASSSTAGSSRTGTLTAGQAAGSGG